jgi:hypothetical protein
MRQGWADGMQGAAAMRRLSLLHERVVTVLRGKRVLMLGDSNMRYQYLDLAYFVCFRVWPSLSDDQEQMQWLWRVSYLWDHDHAYVTRLLQFLFVTVWSGTARRGTRVS